MSDSDAGGQHSKPDGIRQQCSMTYWWPKLQSTGVPVPQTVRVGTEPVEVDDGAPSTDNTTTIQLPDHAELTDAVATVDGPPAFIRNDQMSAKHQMESGARIQDTDLDHLRRIAGTLHEHTMMAFGVPRPEAYYVREWLDLKHEFEAFEHTPIASEVRVFIHEGDVHDYGFYWPHEALEQHRRHEPELRGDWRTLLSQLREHALASFNAEIRPMAEAVADEFDGYWSVDFAETEDGDWYAIDMARGEASWHPESVEKPAAIGGDQP
jgi:hypothetical protein